ncbi:hypothetical protein Pan44_02040 [Caulifigura coniformis]|uniref:Uncharacterized protein n=1 Tax=Caulifigura coniformis TaxID=2527983 RepID=A0A517S7U9_9PLAN|nr:glycosyltransferase family 39 protein [Caulifigura coniformis]QDT52195.1 hypothetical protein Pan44_02040 [Caulifigura coniformis]
MGTSDDRWGFGLLVVAILSALALCAPALRGQALALDEHVSYYCSGAPTVSELWNRCEEVAVLPPLSHLLERLALAMGGHSETVFRVPSLAAYVLAVPAGFWLGRIVAGPLCGGLAALIVAWHPGMLDEVRFARCYGLVLLLASLSMACLLRWRSAPAERRWLAAWTVSAIALCWTHYLTAPLVAAQSVVLVFSAWHVRRSRRNARPSTALVAVIVVGMACVPLLPALLRLREWSGLIEFQRIPPTVLEAFGAPWTLFALLLVLLSCAWAHFHRRRRDGQQGLEGGGTIWMPLFLWLVPLTMIATMALLGSPMLASPRYRVMIVPASALAVGLAATRVAIPPVAACLVAGLLGFTAWSMSFSPGTAARLANPIEEEWKQVGVELASEMGDPGVLVFTQSGLAEGILLPMLADYPRLKSYVACRLGPFYTQSDRALPIPILWDVGGPLSRQYLSLLKAPEIRQVRIVGANDTDLNAQSIEVFASFLRSAGFRSTVGESRPGITLLRFERRGIEDGVVEFLNP